LADQSNQPTKIIIQNEVVTSKTSVLVGAISKLPDVVQLCKVNNPAMAKE
jgi:hypothetical protein